jgi:ribonucleoside-triphosphate reductase
MIQVIKRDGRIKSFDKQRIIIAINKAHKEVYKKGNIKLCKIIEKDVVNQIIDMNKGLIEIEEIQNVIVENIKKYDKDIAFAYERYRREREKERVLKHYNELQHNILDFFSQANDNANIDENSFGGREQRLLQHIEKELALNGMPEYISDLHKKIILYQHDLDKWVIGMHNCLFPRVNEILHNGFKTRQGDVKPPKYFYSVSQVIPVLLQLQSLEQFGGVGIINYDLLMQEYVERSFSYAVRLIIDIYDIEKDIPERLTISEGKKILDNNKFNKAYHYLLREMHQALQALITNLVTLQSRSGSQLPFTSINMGLNTTQEGRLVQSIFLDELEKGIGKHDRTAIFPITCWQTKAGINKYKEDPNFDLLMKALKVANKRLYPTFVNCNWSGNISTCPEEEMNLMGCRTLIGYNVYDNSYNKEGRGNLAPTTINLAYLGLKYKTDLGGLYKELNILLDYAKESLILRYNIMKKQPPSVAPFMYQNGTIMNGEECKDTVENALKNSTLTIGYIGLAECVKAITGFYHNENEEAQKIGVSIIKRIRDFCDKTKKELNLNFAVYATPAEGLCYKAMKSLKQQFGIIEGITDRDYLTNSHHVPVHCGENFFKKADIESEYAKLANGGNIFHIEIDGRSCNEEAMYKMLLYALNKNIPYIRFSHQISTCLDCGYNLPASMDKCEKCGSENVENLAIVTGYLTVDVKNMNKGKQDEVKHRELNTM